MRHSTHSRRPLDQSRSCGARHSRAGARRRDGSRAAAAHPDAGPHAARHRRRADLRALRTRRARSDLFGLATRPQPHSDRRRGARGRGHSLSHCRRRRGHSPSQPGVARRGVGPPRGMSAASRHRRRWRRLGGATCAGERARSALPRRTCSSTATRNCTLPPGAGGAHQHRQARAACLAARRLHADRAAESRRQLHRHAVPAASGRRELRIAHRARAHRSVLPPPLPGRAARCCRR